MSLRVEQADKDNANVRFWVSRSTETQYHLDKYGDYLNAWGCGVADPVGSILEIGIGPYGGFLPLLKAHRKIGLDPCISRFRDAGILREYAEVEYVDKHLEEFETSETFDKIVTADVLDHGALGFGNIPSIAAMLKPGGKLFIHVQLRPPEHLNSAHDHCLTLDQLDAALRETTLIEERREMYPHDILKDSPFGAVMGVWRQPGGQEQKHPTSNTEESAIDILFLGCNRLEYTRETLTTLRANTDWSLVGKLYLYDDQSEDGTREYLEQAAQDMPVDTVFHVGVFNCPLAVLIHAIRRSTAPLFAKVDNDTMMPPGWLNVAKRVMEEHADLDLVGLAFRGGEAGDAATDTFGYTDSPFIGGIGLFRRQVIYDWYDDPLEALKAQPRLKRTLKGIDQSHMNTGWLAPNLPIFFLDHIPFQPWLGYGERYVEQGWQRKCSKYDRELSEKLWGWWKR